MRKRFCVVVSAVTISGGWIANGPAAANPMLVPHGIAAGSLASQDNSNWRGEIAVAPPGYSSRIPEAFYRSADGEACQVEDQWTPLGWRKVTICD